MERLDACFIGERFEVRAYTPEHEDVDDCERESGAPAQSFVALPHQDDRVKPQGDKHCNHELPTYRDGQREIAPKKLPALILCFA